jgi:hypothetical protein
MNAGLAGWREHQFGFGVCIRREYGGGLVKYPG